jgi:hypothetical protein
MLWFLKYFRRKIQQKNWQFWLETKLNYANFWSQHWFFEKNANFFAENLRKSQKIVIITSTPGHILLLKWTAAGQVARPLRSITRNTNFVQSPVWTTQILTDDKNGTASTFVVPTDFVSCDRIRMFCVGK